MEFFDILIIIAVIVISLVTIAIVYWKFFMNNEYSYDSYDEKKNNIFNLAYNIKKNLLDMLEEEHSIPDEYNKVLNETTRKYSKNCDLIEKIYENDNPDKTKINDLTKENKFILKTLLSFEKASLGQNKFNPIIYNKYIEKLKTLL